MDAGRALGDPQRLAKHCSASALCNIKRCANPVKQSPLSLAERVAAALVERCRPRLNPFHLDQVITVGRGERRHIGGGRNGEGRIRSRRRRQGAMCSSIPASRSERRSTTPRTTPASACTSAMSSASRPDPSKVDSTNSSACSAAGIRCNTIFAHASASCNRGCDCTAAAVASQPADQGSHLGVGHHRDAAVLDQADGPLRVTCGQRVVHAPR